MTLTSLAVVWNTVFLQKILVALTTNPAAALAPALQVALYTNDYVPTPNDLAAAYTEATFSGYSHVAPTLVGPVNLSLSVQGMIGLCDFVAAGGAPFVPNTIHGYYCTSGGLLVMSERFQQVVPIAADGAFLALILEIPLPNFQATS